MHTATYGPACTKCGSRTKHLHDETGFNFESVITHLTGCPLAAVGPEGGIEKRRREAREALLQTFTVAIRWTAYLASGEVEVTIQARSFEFALAAALRHNHTRMITEGGAGITSFTARYTPNAELTEEDEFDGC